MIPFDAARTACPLLAVLRGVRPDEVEAIGAELVAAGFTMIEVPLNSPDPYDSIGRLARRFGSDTLIGAGTVLTADEVERVADVGGRLIVSPNTDPSVIAASVALGLASLPGFFTPTEAFTALAAGATALKLFPAEAVQPGLLKAFAAVLPRGTLLAPSGGVTPDNLPAWRAAGAAAFGLGSALYRAGDTPEQVGRQAQSFIRSLS